MLSPSVGEPLILGPTGLKELSKLLDRAGFDSTDYWQGTECACSSESQVDIDSFGGDSSNSGSPVRDTYNAGSTMVYSFCSFSWYAVVASRSIISCNVYAVLGECCGPHTVWIVHGKPGTLLSDATCVREWD